MSDLLKSLPKKIKISYVDVDLKVDEDHEFKDQCYGEFCSRKNEIKLAGDLKDHDISNTILHEIVHASVWYGGLKDDGAALEDDAAEEHVVNVITNQLCQIFKDNPKVLTCIKKGLSKSNGRSKKRDETVAVSKKIFEKYTFHKNRK